MIYLIEGKTKRQFAWRPVWLDGGRLAGKWLWLRFFYANPHEDGFWRDVWSVEEKPDRYVDGREIRYAEEIW